MPTAAPCACPTSDPVECIRRRYPGTSHDAAADEPCTCGCHHDAAEEEDGFDDGPDWCDRCSPNPCDCDDGPDDLSDLGPLDEDDDCDDDRDAIEADVAAGLVYPDCGCGLTRDRLAATLDAADRILTDRRRPAADTDNDCDDNPGSVDGALSRLLDADPGGWAAFVGARYDD